MLKQCLIPVLMSSAILSACGGGGKSFVLGLLGLVGPLGVLVLLGPLGVLGLLGF